MEDDDFCMLPLNCQSTKTLQLGALRVVRASASSAYKSLVEEEKRLCRIFPQHNSSRGSIFMQEKVKVNVNCHLSDTTLPTATIHHTQSNPPFLDIHVLYQGLSLAGKTMERYGHPKDENPHQLPTRKGSDGGPIHMTYRIQTIQVVSN